MDGVRAVSGLGGSGETIYTLRYRVWCRAAQYRIVEGFGGTPLPSCAVHCTDG